MERMYQYLWRTSALGRRFRLTDGREIKVINPGRQNFNAGPDFSNARIQVGETVWCGNVEIHVRASDWFRHNHHSDEAYDQVILHVVTVDDAEVVRRDGSRFPTLVFNVSGATADLYNRLTDKVGERIRCSDRLPSVSRLAVEDWLESLGVERLQLKSGRLLDENSNLAGDWEQTAFVALARGLGFGVNGVPFEMLARGLPLKFIHRHSDNIFQIEALLFGQAGMLDSSVNIFDDYYQSLCREYYFLARKYSLRPMKVSLWKFARMRPQNFPHRRIALLAGMVEGGFSLLTRLLETNDPTALTDLFRRPLSGYWTTHFAFGSEESAQPTNMGGAALESLLINVAAPLLYAFGVHTGNPELGDRAVGLLERIRPEKNSFIRNFESLGLKADNALRSQALVHLHKCYCDEGRCLDCRFGVGIISKVARESCAAYGSGSVVGME